MMRISYPFFFFMIGIIGLGQVFSQDDDPIKVDTSVVRVNVGVVDQRGRPITSLSRPDFKIFEDGAEQNISRFEVSSAPFSVVMLLDMSGSTKSFRQNIRLSAIRFLDALAPDDRVAVVEFYSKIRMLNDFTTNRAAAAHSISVANGEGDTDLYKAISFSLEKLSREQNRRKAIVVLTDGVDTETQKADRSALEQTPDADVLTRLKPDATGRLGNMLNLADALGVTIYPLALPTGDPARLADPTPRQIAMYKAARERLQLIADRSGGTLNSIRRLEEMGALYAVVAADLRTLYTIEYTSDNEKRDGKWRAIKVAVSNPDMIARSRQGYFAR
jgi:Ca-activated chloride channel family protein